MHVSLDLYTWQAIKALSNFFALIASQRKGGSSKYTAAFYAWRAQYKPCMTSGLIACGFDGPYNLDCYSDSFRWHTRMRRRQFFSGMLAGISLLRSSGLVAETSTFTSDPFSLGIASGDMTHDSVVLWTRIAPEPMQPDGGVGSYAVPVRWEVATDPGMRHLVRTIFGPRLRGVHVWLRSQRTAPSRPVQCASDGGLGLPAGSVGSDLPYTQFGEALSTLC